MYTSISISVGNYSCKLRFFCSALWNGVLGVFLCLSTAEATRASKANAEVNDEMRRMGGIDTPERLYFHVYFYVHFHVYFYFDSYFYVYLYL